jgi:hypothetical protein
MILDAIKDYWEYQKSDRPPGQISMSAIGHCARQLAYVKHLTFANQPDWRAKIIFDDGNRHHDQIRLALREGLILQKSCFQLIGEEQEVSLGMLKGHVDGILIHDDVECKDKGHESMLLEVKSMNDRAFAEFQRERKLPYEYECQVSAYLRGSGYDKACILVKNKNTGQMDQMIYTENAALLDSRLEMLAEVMASEEPEQISRDWAYDSKTGKLPWQCGYCPFVELCWRHEGLKQEAPHKYVIPTTYAKNVDTLRKLSHEVATSPTLSVAVDIGTLIATNGKDMHNDPIKGLDESIKSIDQREAKGRKRRKKGLR